MLAAKTDRTTCKWGHPWIAENLTKNSAGITACKLCLKRYKQECIARKRARVGRLHVQTHCSNGHEFTPDNTRIVECHKKDGSTSTFQQCLKCLAARKALVAARKALLPAKRPRGGKPLRDRCKKGHPLKGDNLIVNTNADGAISRSCRKCRNEYMKEREHLKRRGLKPAPIRIDYPSLEAKINALTQVTDGCHIWTGRTTGGDAHAPTVARKTERVSVRPWVCERAGRVIPPKHKCVMKPGCHELCVREDHIEILSGSQIYARFQTREVRDRARQTMVQKFGAGREEFVRSMFALRSTIAGYVRDKIQKKLAHEIEDIVQDSMLATYCAWLNGEAIANLKALLITTAINKMTDRARLVWNRKVNHLSNYIAPRDADEEPVDVLETRFEAPPEHNDPYLLLQRAEVDRLRMRILKERMREMSPKVRKCVLMKLDDCSQKEIAEKLGIAENTVEQHLTKAYRILRGPENQMWHRRERRDSYYLETITTT